ncbi:MAG TPA: class 1 fructose-bisphosphatase [Patescibacteria group bacterium]|nr:class 1 fructose-bisphosphatase [Patescibacteria group bacterium]
MPSKLITLTEFILQEERRFKKSTGVFTLLMTHLENASKIIASHIKMAGLADIVGKTGKKNIYNDEVQKLDTLSNDLLVNTLLSTGHVQAVASEELDKPLYSPQKKGEYTVFLDPLDGSSNIDVNISVGTIFSIYHAGSTLLQKGMRQVAAGYFLYGSSVMFVYSSGNGVNGFTLDPSIGSFLLSHPNMRVPDKGSIYAINEGNELLWDTAVCEYVNDIKKKNMKAEKPYKLRYIGSMVADVHRTLLKGGIFIYPKDKKDMNGKLRLMYEINPLSFIVEQAGGMAVSGTVSPLTIQPQTIHQRTPIALGSRGDVLHYMSFAK